MYTPYGFQLSETCATCKFRADGFFCQLSPSELDDFGAISHISAYPADAVLFVQQQKSRGFFQVCRGEVKLSVSSSEGKTLILRVARSGDVIGIWPAISGAPHEATAECLRPCQVAFVSSSDFRRYLRKHPGVFERTAQYVGAHYRAACEQLSVIGLGASVSERVAKFLLDWSSQTGASKNGYPFTLWLSHDEIANFVGATRESVTRTLSEFRNRGLLETRGSTFIIPNRQALAASDVELDSAQQSALKPQLVNSIRPMIQHKPQSIRSACLRSPIQRKRA